ncbi:glycosyltransferase family 2 protein [uncultured Gemella sp.]|uniref:glycosyltransferase family 2 protein n=1 Tax=uncultured Gemella sp. TaxID=254352 RepID=UPI0028D47C64|nr:glycosyltransferase family 2 protein [uncultured Gemella sp.]
MHKKISIIIPIYNVEKYLRRCIDSIVNQTYKNTEIILVNDGSPDNCREICDEYEEIDSRIKVIHKANGGLSSARNAGLDIASGEYIMFVDSDDWISEDTLEKLNKYVEKGCDIINFKLRFAKRKTENIIKLNDKIKDSYECNLLSYVDKLFSGELDFFICNKLYKKDLFDDVRFPEGRNYEDLATIYKLYFKAKNIVVTDYTLYYYWLENPNSITSNSTIKNMTDYLVSTKEIYEVNRRYLEMNKRNLSNIDTWYKMMLVQLLINYTKSTYKDDDLKREILSELKCSKARISAVYKQDKIIKYALYKSRLLIPIIKLKKILTKEGTR